MRILISERQKKLLTELTWKQSVISHVTDFNIPLTKKIYNILYEKSKIKTFHISDIHNIENIKNLIGKEKSISSFTYFDQSYLQNLTGVQTNGGIIYEITGNLVLYSTHDVMSMPDENGMRWINLDYVDNSNLSLIWKNKLFDLHIYDRINDHTENRTKIIKDYFNAATQFVSENKKYLIKSFIKYDKYASWNEILVSNIEIGDILLIEDRLMSRLRDIKQKIGLDDFGIKLTDNEKFILNNFDNWANKVKSKLLSLSNGKLYVIKNDDQKNRDIIIDFVKSRGGFFNVDEYFKTIESDGNFVKQW